MDFFQFNDDLINDSVIKMKRENCGRCKRPTSACLCYKLPEKPVRLQKTKLIILQHPNEIKRPLNTVQLIQACIDNTDCQVLRGKRFSEAKYPELYEVAKMDNTFLLFPSDTAQDVAEVRKMNLESYNFIVLDGTWRQAVSIYKNNEVLDQVKKMIIKADVLSEYVIRTQPTDKCLSTIECVAHALHHTEANGIREILLNPLRELCKIQLDNGAVKHESREAVNRRYKLPVQN